MNDLYVKTIQETPFDSDYFRIKSQNLDNEGYLRIEMMRAPFGTPVQGGISEFPRAILKVFFNDGSTTSLYENSSSSAFSVNQYVEFDLSSLSNVDYYAFDVNPGNGRLVGGWSDYGARLISTFNSAYINTSSIPSEEELGQLEIESRINEFDLVQAVAYQTGSFSYTNQYGAIGTHSPEEFFTRLFRNKYEQDPSPVQIARG